MRWRFTRWLFRAADHGRAFDQAPEGWQFGTALDTASNKDGTTTFKPVNFDSLVDSPMFAGAISSGLTLIRRARARFAQHRGRPRRSARRQTRADRSSSQSGVASLQALWRASLRPLRLLLALTDTMGGIGLEHHRSSENSTVPNYFTEWEKTADTRDLLPHEFTHSWNGKFRRPADLWTPTFNIPMRDSCSGV